MITMNKKAAQMSYGFIITFIIGIVFAGILIWGQYGSDGLFKKAGDAAFDVGDGIIKDSQKDAPPTRTAAPKTAQETFDNLFLSLNKKYHDTPCFYTWDELEIPEGHAVHLSQGSQGMLVQLKDMPDPGVPGGTTYSTETIPNMKPCVVGHDAGTVKQFLYRWTEKAHRGEQCEDEDIPDEEDYDYNAEEGEEDDYDPDEDTYEPEKSDCVDTYETYPACEDDEGGCPPPAVTYRRMSDLMIYYDGDTFKMRSPEGRHSLMSSNFRVDLSDPDSDRRDHLLLYHAGDGNVCFLPIDDSYFGNCDEPGQLMHKECWTKITHNGNYAKCSERITGDE